MLFVRCEVRPSPLHGLGLFLLEPVKAGAVVWSYENRVDRLYRVASLAVLPAHVADRIRHYGYQLNADDLVLCGDDARFINHADEPTTREDESMVFIRDTVAARDLAVGDELTEDYRLTTWEGRKNPL